jgi:hypothetical protein
VRKHEKANALNPAQRCARSFAKLTLVELSLGFANSGVLTPYFTFNLDAARSGGHANIDIGLAFGNAESCTLSPAWTTLCQ